MSSPISNHNMQTTRATHVSPSTGLFYDDHLEDLKILCKTEEFEEILPLIDPALLILAGLPEK